MKKLMIILPLFLLLATGLFLSFAQEKPPPDLPYIEGLPAQSLIIGQYIVHMPKLTQAIFDAAKMTVTNEQGIYYKSEFAGGTWFNIGDATELTEIQLTGNTETISPQELSTMYFILQVPKDGDDLIFFKDAGAADTRYDLMAKALEEEIKKTLGDGTGGEALLAQAEDIKTRLQIFNVSAGKAEAETEEKPTLLTQVEKDSISADIAALQLIAESAGKKGFANLATEALGEIVGKLLLMADDALNAAALETDAGKKSALEAQAAKLSNEAGALKDKILAAAGKPSVTGSAGELASLVQSAVESALKKAVFYGGAGAARPDLSKIPDGALRSAVEGILAAIGAGVDPADTGEVLSKSFGISLESIQGLRGFYMEEKIQLLTSAHNADRLANAMMYQMMDAEKAGNLGEVNRLLDQAVIQLNLRDEALNTYRIKSAELAALEQALTALLDKAANLNGSGSGSPSSGPASGTGADIGAGAQGDGTQGAGGDGAGSGGDPSLDFSGGINGLSLRAQNDLNLLLRELHAFRTEYDEAYELRILQLMKERYRYLVDYEIERKNQVSYSREVLTEKIRGYDVLINTRRAYVFVDTVMIDYQYAYWKALQENKQAEARKQNLALEKHLREKVEEKAALSSALKELELWLQARSQEAPLAQQILPKLQGLMARLSEK